MPFLTSAASTLLKPIKTYIFPTLLPLAGGPDDSDGNDDDNDEEDDVDDDEDEEDKLIL